MAFSVPYFFAFPSFDGSLAVVWSRSAATYSYRGDRLGTPTARMTPTRTKLKAEPSAAPARRKSGAAAPKQGVDRRSAILLAAQKLFAEAGYHAVSIRDIAKEAAVPLALVGYYFGAKHELFHAIFDSWSEAINGRQRALSKVVVEPDPDRRLQAIVRTFALPLVELHQRPEGKNYARMASRFLATPSPEVDRVHREIFDPLANSFIEALISTGDGVTRGRAAWCYQFMLGALIHFLSDTRVEHLSNGENRATDPKAAKELIAFLDAGCRALLRPKETQTY